MFDDRCEVRGLSFEILNTFDKAWYTGLIYRFKQNKLSGNLLNLIIDFLDAREQIVVLNSQYSSWTSVKAKVPQGWILGPLFLSIIINGISDNFVSNSKLFVDDTFLFSVVQDITLWEKTLNDGINNWVGENDF